MLGATAALIVLVVGCAGAGVALTWSVFCPSGSDAFAFQMCGLGMAIVVPAGMGVATLFAIPVGYALRMRWWWWPTAIGSVVGWGYALDLVGVTLLWLFAAGGAALPFLAAAVAAPRGTGRRDRVVVAAIALAVGVVVAVVVGLVLAPV